MKLLWGLCVLLCLYRANASTAGFIKSPLSQMKLVEDSAELHCEVVGNPLPEVQWWFIEGEEPNETLSQLFDGAREDRVRLNATHIDHTTSTLTVNALQLDDSGTYECRASNDPDRNELQKSPKIKWIRSQANVLVFEQPDIVTEPASVFNLTSAVLTCNLTAPPGGSSVSGSYWSKNGVKIEDSAITGADRVIKLTLSKIDPDDGGEYECVFLTTPEVKKMIEVKTPLHVKAKKPTEHGNEKDKGTLSCEAHGFPLATDWVWEKVQPDGATYKIENGTSQKYQIKSTVNKTTLYIQDLDMEADMGDYQCKGLNADFVDGSVYKIHLRVRSRLAALWPFLGIVAEVIVLITIIFCYEKRRKPDEVNDDDDSGSAPLKSNATNHKDKNVRQRNSN